MNDGQLDSAPATVNINVTAGNAPPTAFAQNVTGLEDAPLSITLTGTDPENAPLTFSIVSAPQNGSLTGSGANRTFTPAAQFNGSTSFAFK